MKLISAIVTLSPLYAGASSLWLDTETQPDDCG
jgi:hypothetical protein